MALARIAHRFTAAAADLLGSTALRSVRLLDLLSRAPARRAARAPGLSRHLRALAARTARRCGLGSAGRRARPASPQGDRFEDFFRRQSTPALVVAVAGARILDINEAAASLLAVPAERALGRSLGVFLEEEAAARLISALRGLGPESQRCAGSARARAAPRAGPAAFEWEALLAADAGTAFLTAREPARAPALDAYYAASGQWAWYWDAGADTLEYVGDTPAWLRVPAGPQPWAAIGGRMPPADRRRLRAAMVAALDSREGHYACEYQLQGEDGVQRWIAARGRVARDSAGRAVGLLGSSTDITDREQLEARLRMAQATGGMWFWERNLETGAVGFLGSPPPYLRSDTNASDFNSIARLFHPDDFERAEREMAQGAARPEQDLHLEYRMLWPDDSVRWVEVLGRYVRDSDGRVRRVLGASTDITARKEAEQRLRREEEQLRIASAAAGLAVWDLDPRTHEVTFIGTPPAYMPAGRWRVPFARLAGMMRPAERRVFLRRWLRFVKAGQSEDFEAEVRFREPGAEADTWLRINARHQRDAVGEDERILGTCLDITAMMRQQERLLGNERQFRLAQSATRFWSWSLDPASGWAEFLGRADPWTGSDVQRDQVENFLRVTVEADRAALTAMLARCLEQPGEVQTCELRQRRDGDERCVALRGQCVLDRDGGKRIVGTTLDITDQRRQSEALRVSESRFRGVFENSPVAMLVFGEAGEVMLANPAMYRLLGVPAGAGDGGRAWPQVDEISAALWRAGLERLEHREESSFEMEACWRRADGSSFPAQVTVAAVRDHGADAPYYVAQLQDLSMLREREQALAASERSLRSLIYNLPGIAFCLEETAAGLRPSFLSGNVRAITGHQPDAFTGGRLLWDRDVVLAEDRAHTEPVRRSAIEAGKSSYETAYRIRGADGRTRWVSERGHINYEQRQVSMVWGFTQDITLQERSRRALQMMAESTATFGEPFFQGLVVALAQVLGARYAMVAAVDEGDERRLSTLAVCCEDRLLENFTYARAGSPCAQVLAGGTRFHQGDLQEAFAGYELVGALGVASYLGAPLLASDGRRLGVLAVMDEEAIDEAIMPRRFLELFATRAAAELERHLLDRERQRAEQGLRTSLATLRAILESTEEAILVVDEAGRVSDFNSNFLALWGLSEEQVRGSDLPAIEQAIRAARHEPDAQVGLLGAGAGAAQALHLEDGRVLECYSQPLMLRGEAIGRVLSQRDVTERREAAERLKTERALLQEVLDANPTFIFVKDRDSRYRLANRAVLEVTGRSADQLIGEHERDIWPDPQVVGDMLAQDARVLELGEEIFIPEERITDTKGRDLWVQTTKRPLRNSDGEIERMLGVSVNITERKHAEQKLRRAVAELGLAEERERKRLAALLHDNIVQDLGLAKLRVGALRRGEWPEDKAAELQALTDLLSATIRESRGLMFEISPPVLYEFGLTAALEWLAERAASQASLAVELELDEALNELPSDTQVMLFQILRELLTNVRKHASARQVWLRSGGDSGALYLEVADDGVGFQPPAALAARSDSGFGLVSIRDRIDLLGGSLTLDAGKGAGTRVRLTIPRAAAVQSGS